MKIVWQLETATVRDVYEALRARRQIAYTTVMTMMNVLEGKKYLKKRLQDRAYIYQPTQPQHKVLTGMVREFVNRVFDGSAQPLLLHLVKGRHLSEKDLTQIKRLMREDKSQ